MSKRINIILPEATVAVLDRVVPQGNLSRFIDRAVLHLVKTEGTANLQERLKAGALANASWIWNLPRSGFQWSEKHGRDSNAKNASQQRLSAAGRNLPHGARPGARPRDQKTRPALVIQNDVTNEYSQTTIVAAITSKVNIPPYPNEALIQSSADSCLQVFDFELRPAAQH
jgi:hypothetical protein